MTGASATTITPMTTVAMCPTRAICLSDLFFPKIGLYKSSVNSVVVLFNEPTNELNIAPKITAPNKPNVHSGNTEVTSAG